MTEQPRIVSLRFQWFDENPIKSGDSDEDAYPGCDGMAVYTLRHPDWVHGHCTMTQPFAKGPTRDVNGRPVWGWDGNREAPTLTPSYLCRTNWGPTRTGVRLHCFIKAGRIDLCSDSNVTLALAEEEG